MAEEKRVKLGVDIGELSNQLVQINNTIEQNYQKALQGQTEYNKILETSIELLQKQSDLVGKLKQQNNIIPPNSSINEISQNKKQDNLSSAPKSEIVGSKSKDSSEIEELIKSILSDTDQIWEKFSSLITPIPVEIVNTPLEVIFNGDNNRIGGAAAVGTTVGGITGSNPVGASTNNNDNNNRGGGNAIGRVTSIAAGGASDPNYIVAGLAGMIPIVGMGVASVVSKMINEAEQRVRASAIFRGATGGNLPFMSLQELGYKNAEAYQREAQYYPANIHLDLKDLEFEKGYGIGGGTINSLLRSMREDVIQRKYGTSSSELGVTYLTMLRGEGEIDSKKVRGYTEDYLKILIDLNQKQLETTGETNSIINTEVVSNIAKASDKFGDPTVLQRVVQSIQGGLTQAPSAQTEALQYWAMSQANPKADIWQMQLMRENPFGAESRGYFSNYLKGLLQTGNATDVRFNVMNAFGLSAHQTEELLNGINRAKSSANKKGENFNLTEYLEGSDFRRLTSEGSKFTTDAGSQIKREANRATAENEVLLAQAADKLADVGEPIIKFTNQAIEKTSEVVDILTNFFEDGLSGTLKGFWNDIKEDLKSALPWGGSSSPSDSTSTGGGKIVSSNVKTNSISPNTTGNSNASSH